METIKFINGKEYFEKDDGTLVPVISDTAELTVTFDKDEAFALIGLLELIFDETNFDPVWFSATSGQYFHFNFYSTVFYKLYLTITEAAFNSEHDSDLLVPSETMTMLGCLSSKLEGIVTEQLGVITK